MPNENLRCRVCGLLQDDPPWGADGRTPNFEICVCCGTEFGYEDISRSSVLRKRAQWLSTGARWFDVKWKPADWNLDQQVSAVPEVFKD